MRITDIIAAKRDGRELEPEDIESIVLGSVRGDVADYQMSAFLMACYIRGLSRRETFALTMAMVASGSVLDLSSIPGYKVDKHSTGGVGDKATLVVVPILAACGLKVPKMSGRGLGFTGGTLDKLESIPGFRTRLSNEQIVSQVREVGAVMAGQTAELVPADKLMYALRDVTATVDSIPLISASVMSKKIACGADHVLLDVKAGSGALAKDIESARCLADLMIDIGKNAGRHVAAVITDMSQPLGHTVGNAIEVAEAIETLKGAGPPDLREICLTLSGLLVEMCGASDGLAQAAAALESGAALEAFRRVLRAQGGDEHILDDPLRLPRAAYSTPILSKQTGHISSIDCAMVGTAALLLGAGREHKEDSVDHAVGLRIHVKVGDYVSRGDQIAELYANDSSRVDAASRALLGGIVVGDCVVQPPRVLDVLR